MKAYVFLLVVLLGVSAASQDQRPRFVGTTNAVRLEVSVFNERGVVIGLKAGDFEVKDSGIDQTFSVEEISDLLLDLVVVVPPLESLEGDQVHLFGAALRTIAQQVTPNDRLGLLLADFPPIRVRRLAAGPVSLEQETLRGARESAVLDAVAAAFSEFSPSERRQILIVITSGFDRFSAVTDDMLVPLARRTSPQIIFIGAAPSLIVGAVIKPVPTAEPRSRLDFETTALFGNRFPPPGLRKLAAETGGQVIDLNARDPKKTGVELIARLRRGYVISYPASASKGWHPVTVRVKRRNVTVAARAGYFVD